MQAASWAGELDLDSQVILTSYCVHTDGRVTHDHIATTEAKNKTSDRGRGQRPARGRRCAAQCESADNHP